MEEISIYNQRQIRLMEERIKWYRQNKIGLLSFINDMDALLRCIKDVPIEWGNKTLEYINELDIIYAWADDEERELTTAEQKQVLTYIDLLEKQMTWYKQHCLPAEDEELI